MAYQFIGLRPILFAPERGVEIHEIEVPTIRLTAFAVGTSVHRLSDRGGNQHLTEIYMAYIGCSVGVWRCIATLGTVKKDNDCLRQC